MVGHHKLSRMSTFMMPYVSKRHINISPNFSSSQLSPTIVSESLEYYLRTLKCSIDEVQKDWDIYKKYTNPYEAIHTPNFGNGSQPVCTLRPISRSFFKMIEICATFDLLKNMPCNMRSFHIAEGPGGFIEALASLRRNPNDSYVGMTLISEDQNVPGWRKSQAFLSQNKNVHIEFGDDDTGDITKERNLLYCSGHYGATMDFVTADGGFDFSNDFNTQEGQMLSLLICQVAFATALQKKGGTLVLKVFDIFSRVSVELVYLLSIMYERVQIIKPNTSRYANSERYVVAQDFRSADGRKEWTIQFASFFERLTTENVVSLLDEPVPRYFLSKLEESNASLGQQQMDTISNTLSIIKNPRQDRMEKMRLANIQKCVAWCQRHKLPFNRDVRHFNMFLSAKNKVSRLPRKKAEENGIDVETDGSNDQSPELLPVDFQDELHDIITCVDNVVSQVESAATSIPATQ